MADKIEEGRTNASFKMAIFRTLMPMANQENFSLDDHLEKDAPKKALRTPREAEILREVQCGLRGADFLSGEDIMIDLHNSAARIEFANGISKCVRPSSVIRSIARNRYVYGREFFSLQGIWAEDLPNPQPMQMMQADADNDGVCKDLGGNAMATTVFQANLIASLCHCFGWRHRRHLTG